MRLSHIVQKYQDIDKMTVLTCHAMMSNEQARDAPMTMSCCIVNFKISNTQKETKKLAAMTKIRLSLASLLLLWSPTASAFTPSSMNDVVNSFRKIYNELESADVWHPVSPTIRFNFVPPNSNGKNNVPSISLSSAGNATAFDQVEKLYGTDKPIAVYLPGLDGFGISATQQYEDLAESFEVWRMTISSDDKSSFQQLISSVTDFIRTLDDETRPITLIGESFGGLLAPAVALHLQNSSPNHLEGMVLINPATSFDETQWSTLGPLLASLRHLPSIPNLPNAYSVFGGLALMTFVPDRLQFQKIISMLLGMDLTSMSFNEAMSVTRDGFGLLEERLPAEVVSLRVGQWLPVGSSVVNPRLSTLNVPTLVIAGEDDVMLPSKQEANRLVDVMPNCTKLMVRGAGHFVLDDRVNLTEAIAYAEWDPLNLQTKKFDPITDWKLPPDDEVTRIIEERVDPLRRLASPVFFSTDNQGKRYKGLSKLPPEGPLLFVANHQLLGLDLGMIIAELLQERGIVVRGLAHPVIFQNVGQNTPRGVRDQNLGPLSNDLFQKFGAVMVTPRNYYRLFQTGQNALLFPGGVREVFHGKDEAYQLFWPKKVDFVRTAARFNATVIPISAVGAADSLNVLVDAADVVNLPFGLGQRAIAASANTTSARFNMDDDSELFLPPVVVPSQPARHYFMFGKPMSTKDLHHGDMASCQAFYQEVQDELVRGFDDILAAREHDPFGDPVRRLAYERILGKKAPTFGISELNTPRH